MIKILIITTVKVSYDGLTNHILSYVEEMNKDNLVIDLVSARGIDSKIDKRLKNAGFNKINRLEFRDNNQLKYFMCLTKLIRKEKYNIVHAHGNSATLAIEMAAAFFGGCKVRIAHSHNTQCEHKTANKLLKPFFNLFYTDGFACGEEAGKWLFKNRKFTIIPNGIKINKFVFNKNVRERIRQNLNIEKNTIAIGNVAAFVKKKNHIFLINTFNELLKKKKNYKLFLFGIEGDNLEKVISLIKELKLEEKIIYMGTKENINEYLNAMDIMVLPSEFEGFPISVIEWQINGLPCILSNTITDKCKISNSVQFVPINNGINPWINAIINLNQRNENGNDILVYNNNFDINANAEKLKQLYIELVNKRKVGV